MSCGAERLSPPACGCQMRVFVHFYLVWQPPQFLLECILKVFLDFETRSEVDIRKSGQSVYASSPTTEPLCLAAKSTGGHEVLWLPGDDLPHWFVQHVESGGQLHAHNAAFEIAIWNKVMAPRYGWPEAKLEQWHCTAARCAALALPRSLAGAGAALGLDVQKDNEGHRVMLKLCKPRRPSKHDKRKWFDDPEDFQTLYKYCQKDVEAEMAIHEATVPLQKMNRQLWLLDQMINNRGIPMDREFIENVLATDEIYKKQLLEELRELTGNQVMSASQRTKLIEWLNIRGCNIGDTTKKTVAATLKDKTLAPECRRALEIRQLLSRTSTAKYASMLSRMDDDDKIRGVHLFHGASTGRFAGMGVQFQNMPRPKHDYETVKQAIELFKSRNPELIDMLLGEQSELSVSCIRSAAKARDGHRFIVCDFSGIEARVLGWLAEEENYQEVFRNRQDIYVDFAAKLQGVEPEEVSKSQRFLGKVGILALGYGQGPGVDPKFNSGFYYTARDWGCPIEKDVAVMTVNAFRNEYSRIRSFWYDMDRAAKAAVRDEKKRVHKAGRINFGMSGDFLKMQLPSGRLVSYYKPVVRYEETKIGRKECLVYWGTNSVTKKWEETRTYGGKLVENAVQGTALDLFANALALLSLARYPVVFHVHDEVIIEKPIGEGKLSEVKKIMCNTPDWAKGCVVDAEGFEEERFRKD